MSDFNQRRSFMLAEKDAAIDLAKATREHGALPIDLDAPDFRGRGTSAHGLCLFREFRLPSESAGRFWQSYKHDRGKWLAAGVSVTKVNEAWTLIQWLLPDGSLTAVGNSRLADWRSQNGPPQSTVTPATLHLESVPVVKTHEYAPPIVRRGTDPLYISPDEYEPVSKLEPVIESRLYDYQRKPARVLMDAVRFYNGAFDCSDMGTGKTAQCLAAAVCTYRNVAVVCPKSIRSGWLKMARHFGVDVEFVHGYEKIRAGSTKHYTQSRGWLMDKAKDEWIIIFDEAHKMKNAKTATAQLLRWAVEAGIPTIDASGTMATAPWELEMTGRAIKLHNGSGRSWDEFLRKYGAVYNKWMSKWQMTDPSAMAKLNREIFHAQRLPGSDAILPPRGTRVRITDLGDRFPETQIIADAFSVDADVARRIDKAFSDAEERVELVRRQLGDGAAAKQQQAEFIRAWHEAEVAKIPAIVQMVHEELENDRSVAVFVNFNDSRQELMKLLHTRCGIFGGQSENDRNRCIAAFQADRERVIVANLTAGGVGVSLHDENGRYPRSSIILPNPRANDFKQAMGRVHRSGGKSKSRQIVFFAEGTVEEAICDRVRQKLKNVDALNDGWLDPKATF